MDGGNTKEDRIIWGTEIREISNLRPTESKFSTGIGNGDTQNL